MSSEAHYLKMFVLTIVYTESYIGMSIIGRDVPRVFKNNNLNSILDLKHIIYVDPSISLGRTFFILSKPSKPRDKPFSAPKIVVDIYVKVRIRRLTSPRDFRFVCP
uniref:Uncharacterized protein n=1 Tax=Cacopsylla melanoneura TaxID=428564 RepID=A0A8D8TG56_9HEMI